jgi:NAD(P)-dependent dehydrogenase (short-subunit alcohol dehydrogenase family)
VKAGRPDRSQREEYALFELKGRRALVTGAGDGMGVGIALALARQGAVVAVNDLVAERADTTVNAIRANGGQAVPAPFDVSDEHSVREGVRHAAEALGGPIEILVNNAGIPAGMGAVKFRDLSRDMWPRYIDLNLYGSLYCISEVVDDMVAAGWGRIVQISSGAGRTGLNIGVSLYGASKSGVEGFIRHLSAEIARTGVTANILALGLMSNTSSGDTTVTEHLARSIPVGRLGTPDDVGATVAFLASDEAEWLTGQTINLNGGSTMN